MSTNRVSKKIYDGEIPVIDTLKEDPGRDGAVSLMNNILSNSNI